MCIAVEKYYPETNLYPTVCMEERGGVNRVFVGKPEGKRPL